MSKTIDEKVVEMRFDNKQFEANVQTTLSSLDKLKAKLNLTGASKGLETISAEAKKVSFINIENSLASLEKRFSTTGIIGMTMISNLTTSAMQFASKLAKIARSSLIDGGKTRATNLENARFQLKGLLKDADKVEAVMKDVEYGVQDTAYSLDAAAKVASQLAASGMKAGNEMKAALRGISGVAAMTNSSYEDIGNIFTRVAGQGRVMATDLNSLAARGMNAAATLGDALGKTEAEIRDMVSKGKISFEIFSKAMDDAFGEHAKEANNTVNGAVSNIKSALARIGAEFVSPLIKENGPLVQFLNNVRVRINEIKSAIVPVAEEVTTRINNFITAINNAFKNGNILGYNPFNKLKKSFEGIQKVISKTTEPINKVSDTIKGTVKELKDYSKVVDEIIAGKWGNNPVRKQKLEEAGYSFAHAQNLVNEKLGNSYRYVDDYVESQEGAIKSTEELTESTTKLIAELTTLSDEQLKEKGYTSEQIDALRELSKIAKKTGIPIEDLIKNMDNLNARFLIFNSFKNIGLTLVSVLKSVGSAIGDVFAVKPEGLFDIIAGFHKFSTIIRTRVEKNADSLTRTLRGLFSIIHLISSFIGAGFKVAFKILETVLSVFNLSILDFTAIIGDAIYNFDRWITQNNFLVKSITAVTVFIRDAVIAVKEWVTQNDRIMAVANKIKNAFLGIGDSVKAWTKGLRETDNIPKYIFQGLINGLKAGGQAVFDIIASIGIGLIEAIKKVLGIHSPSTVFYEIGVNIIQGLVNGVKFMFNAIVNMFKNLGINIVEVFKNIDIGKIVAVGIGIGLIKIVKDITGLVNNLTKPLIGLGDLLSGIGVAISSLGSLASNFGKSMKANAIANVIKSIAIGIGVLAASVYFLAKLDPEDLKRTVIYVGILAGILGVLSIAITKLASVVGVSESKMSDMFKIGTALIGLSLSLLIMTSAVKKISSIAKEDLARGIFSLIAVMGGMILLLLALGKVIEKGNNLKDAGKMMTKLSISLLLIVGVMKLAGKLNGMDMLKAAGVMIMFGLFAASLIAVSSISGEHADKAGKMVKKISFSLLLIVGVMKLAGMLKAKEIENGSKVMSIFLKFVASVVAVSLFAGENADKAGAMLLELSLALIVCLGVIKLAGMLKAEEIFKGLIVIGALSLFAAGLIAVSQKAGKHAVKVGSMLLTLSGALVILTALIFIISKMDTAGLAKGLIVIGILELLFMGIIGISALAKDLSGFTKTLLIVTGAIAILIAALIGLTFLDTDKVLKAAESLGLIMLSLGGALLLVSKSSVDGRKIKGVMKTLYELTGLFVILGVVTALMSRFGGSASQMIGGATSVGTLLLLLAGSLKIMSKMSVDRRSIKSVIKTLYELSGIMVVLGGIITLMSRFGGNASSMLASVASIEILLLSMVGVLAVLGTLNKFNLDYSKGMVALLGLSGIVAIVAIIIGALSNLGKDPKSMISSATALSELLLSMTLVLGALAVIGKLQEGAFIGIAAFAAFIVTLGGLLVILGTLFTNINGLEGVLDKGIVILGKLGDGLGTFFGSIINGFMNAATTNLGDIGERLSDFIEGAEPFIDGVKKVDGSVITGVSLLTAAILELTVANFIERLGTLLSFGSSLSDLGTNLSDFINEASDFIDCASTIDPNAAQGMKTIAEAILEITKGELLDSLVQFISKKGSLADFGSQLKTLGTGFADFIEAIGTFSTSQVTTVECAGAAIKALASAAKEVPSDDGLWQQIFGKNGFYTFSSHLPKLGSNMSGFMKNLGTFSNAQVATCEAAGNAIKALGEAANAVPKDDGLWQQIFGKNGFYTFSAHLPKLGTNMSGFIKNLGTFDEAQINTTTAAGEAIKALAAAAKEVPKDDGLWQKIFGQNGFYTFSEHLPKLGSNVRGFINNLKGVSKDDSVAAEAAGATILKLAQAAKEIPTEGGLKKLFDGKSGLVAFGDKLPGLGTNIKDFANNLGDGFSVEKANAVSAAGQVIKTLAEAAKTIADNNTGFVFDGNSSFFTFANFLPNLGIKLSLFSLSVLGFSYNKANVDAACDVLTTLAGVYKDINTTGSDDSWDWWKSTGIAFLNFGGNLPVIGECLNDFVKNLTDFSGAEDKVNSAIKILEIMSKVQTSEQTNLGNFADAIDKLTPKLSAFIETANDLDSTKIDNVIDKVKAIASISDIVTDDVSKTLDTFTKSLTDFATNVYKGMGEIIKSETAKETIKKDIIELIGALEDGITGEQDNVTLCFLNMAAQAVKGLNDEQVKKDASNVGLYLAQGFAKGINDNVDLPRNAATSMGKQVISALKSSIDSNSPSKEAMKIGGFFDSGFVLGIKKFADGAYKESYKMGDYAKEGLSNAIEKVSNLISSGMDDDLTIRPVLDLSDVESGVGRLNSMFKGTSVGVMGNLNAISSGMNNRGQNGDSIVSAINRLRKDLGNTGGDTYNINGITYDDGNNIHDAVKTLVRAAKIERRV